MAFYVSPKGSDNNPGTVNAPFMTLARAVDETRLSGEKEILLFGGVYENTSVTLDGRDCGLSICSCSCSVREGEPVLRGGVKIYGWEKIDGDLYSLSIPASIAGDIRALEVNGRLCMRSRFPKSGSIEHLTECRLNWMSTSAGGWDVNPTEAQMSELIYDRNSIPDGFDWNNAELTVFHRWDESYVGVKSHDSEKNLLELYPPCGHPVGGFGVKKYIIWNTEYGMEPGCWRFDKADRKIYYRAMPNENMQNAETYIPLHDHIIKIDGEISGLEIKNITFMTASAPMMPGGFGAIKIPGAIESSYGLDSCSFKNLTFKNIGGWGIKLWGKNGSNKNISVNHCCVENAGAGGILISEAKSGSNMLDGGKSGCVISENRVERIGLLYFSGAGIYGTRCDIIENTLDNLPYTGIVYAGGDNGIISRNRITNVMQILHDGAGIYVTFCKSGVMNGNIVENVGKSGEYFSQRHGLYFDEHTFDCTAEGNIVINCADAMLNHMASGNIVRNNIFAIHDGDIIISFIRCENCQIAGNAFHSNGAFILAGRKNAITLFENNNIYSAIGDVKQIYIEDDYSRSQPVIFDGKNALK